jgi:hypothetical protein
MSFIKISQLPQYQTINANTANTLFLGVDLPTLVTYSFTAHTLAQGLYANEILNVGVNPVLFPNTVAQFSGSDPTFLQMNMQNFDANGSGDIIVTNDSNTAYIDMGIGGTNYNRSSATAYKPNDGYIYVNSGTNNTGNLFLATETTGTGVVFAIGGSNTTNIVAKFTSTGLVLNTQSFLTFSDDTKQSTAGAPYAQSNAAFLYANTQIGLIDGINSTQNTILSAAFSKANTANITADAAFLYANTQIGLIDGINSTQNTILSAAFSKANNALANTSGAIFDGNLTITGNITARSITTSNTVLFIGANVSSANALVEIIGSFEGARQTPSQDGYMLHITGKANVATRLIMDAFGVANNYNVIAGRGARGTAAVPTPTQNNDVMMRISGNGWGSTQFAPLGVSKIDFVAAENYTDTARGSRIEFWNVKIGSNTLTEIASFNGDRVAFTGHVEPARGFVYTATNLVGPQTAITIDIANNSIVRANVAASCTVTLSNFYKGKAVELWITNTSGGTEVFTHGCTALNSTTNSTTYTIPSTSTILVKYMSFETNLANTFVSIVHA